MILATSTTVERLYDTAYADGLLFKVDGITENQKFDGSSWTKLGIVAPTGTATVTSAGSGSITATWEYYMTYSNSATGHESNGLALGSVSLASASATSLSALPVSSDSQVDKKKIYRSVDVGSGTASAWYYLKTIDNSATATTDSTPDASIDTDTTLATTNGVALTARTVEFHKGRLFLGGDGREARGRVLCTSATATVVGATAGTNQTYFDANMAGKYFIFNNEAVKYTISSVDTATQTITLTDAYAGTTASGTYTITGDPNRLQISEASKPEAFRDTYSLAAGDDWIIGWGSLYNDLILFMRRSVNIWDYSVSPDPVAGSGTRVLIDDTVGCISERTIARCGNYMLFCGDSGVYQIEARAGTVSSYDVKEVSIAIRDRFKNDIVKTNADYFHAFYSKDDNSYHLFVYEDIYDDDGYQVPTAQKVYPNVEYVYNFDTQTWARHAFVIASASAKFSDAENDEYVWITNGMGVLFEYGRTEYDGYSFTGTVSSATTSTLTCSTTFPTSGTGLKGVPCKIETGTGADQIRRVLSNTTSTLTMETSWNTIPDSSSTFSLGAMDTVWRSKQEDFGTPDQVGHGYFFHLTYRIASATGTTIRVRFLQDASLTPITPTADETGFDGVTITAGDPYHVVDATYAQGNVSIPVAVDARYLVAEFSGGDPSKPFEILGYSWDYRKKQDLTV